MHSWVIFDGDNTLWEVESLYNEARGSLCHFLEGAGPTQRHVEDFQQKRDKELYATYGYSACRFARSFEDTILHFIPNASAKDVRHVRSLALLVFEQKAAVSDGLKDLLDTLAGQYQLGIITAGERWVQERRLRDFHLQNNFKAIEIVDVKSKAVFQQYCAKHSVDIPRSWVVGDSVNSDVIPALAAGLKAVHVQAENWHHVEGQTTSLPDGVPTVRSILEIRPLLLSTST